MPTSGEFQYVCGTNNTWDRSRNSNRVNDTVKMLEYTCIIYRWYSSHSGCEVVVKARYLCRCWWCRGQRREANKNIWRPCLLACLTVGLQLNLIYFTAAHNLPLFIAFFGNHLILVALHKVYSLLPPSKLSYRCLATGVEDVVP